MRQYVLGFQVSPKLDQILLIQKARPDWQAGRLNGIGGHVEPGETPIQAMVREFAEETPWGSEAEDWTHYAYMDKRGEWAVSVFFTVRHGLGDHRTLDEIQRWNAKPKVDEPLHVVLFQNLLVLPCIANLPGLIGFIRDTARTQPIEIRY